MKSTQLESGQIIVASLELEELSEKRQRLATGSHGGCRRQRRGKGADSQNDVENGKPTFHPVGSPVWPDWDLRR